MYYLVYYDDYIFFSEFFCGTRDWFIFLIYLFFSVSLFTQLCLTLCNAMDCSMPGLPLSITNSRSLLKLMSIESVMPSNCSPLSSPLSSPSFPAFNLSQHQGFFPMCQFFTSNGQADASASASVPPMNI